jgi:hypothetical protein
VDQQGGLEVTQNRRRLPRPLSVVGGEADVEHLALAHGRVEGAHRLLQRRRSVQSVGVEDVDVLQPYSLQ